MSNLTVPGKVVGLGGQQGGVFKKVSKNVINTRLDDSLGTRMETMRTNSSPLETVEEYVEVVERLWQESQNRFLAIGRHLLNAKRTLAHGEWEVMITDKLPFSRSVAHSLRAVAEAIEVGRLSEAEMPNSYATAYKLTALSDPDLARAREQNLVRPNVTRAEVDVFRKSLRGGLNTPPERAALEREKQKLENEIAAAQRRIAEIENSLRNDYEGNFHRSTLGAGKTIDQQGRRQAG